jgi:hypothetical protein
MRSLKQSLIALGLVSMFGVTSAQSAGSAVAQELAASPQRVDKGLLQPVDGQKNPHKALLGKIAAWLSENFELPATKTFPAIVLVPQARMTELRYRDTVTRGSSPAVSGKEPGSIVALYDPLRRTIYFANGWRGDTPTEVSILVHEMVHFLQDIAGETFECPQARERMAYAAQERWLAISGHSLAQDFDVDAFTLLVRSSCMH